MATLNEVKYETLRDVTGIVNEVTMNEVEMVYLGTLGHTTGTLNERWVQEFLSAGVSRGAWNDMAYEYLGLNGSFADTLNERWYQYWEGGGAGGISLISNTDAVAALWTERGANTVVDNIPAGAVEITNVDNDGGCYLRLSTTTILSEALVDGQTYRIIFNSKTAGLFYLGLSSDAGNRIMGAGINGVEFKPFGSTDLAATFLNISLPAGAGQIEVIDFSVLVFKL